MPDLRTKLEAVVRIGRHLPQIPDLTFLFGFLAGNLSRLHFVRSLEGAPVAISVATGRRHIWPGSVFEARVHEVPVPFPATLVSTLAENEDPICLRASFDDPAESAWFEALLVDSYHSVRDGQSGDSLSERMRSVRGRIDQSLDVYRECRRLLGEGTGEDAHRLKFFLGLAQDEIEGLGRQLAELTSRLQDGRAPDRI